MNTKMRTLDLVLALLLSIFVVAAPAGLLYLYFAWEHNPMEWYEALVCGALIVFGLSCFGYFIKKI